MKDDGEDKNDSKRRIRNLSEKKRRDQFNLLISELSSLVLTNSRKTDKSTVLKSTISFLKKHNEITVRSSAHDNQDDWKVKFLSNEEFSYLMLEALEGFMVVFSISGRICYVSDSISSLLGHNPADIVNKSLFELVFKDDQQIIYDLLQRPGNITDPIQAGKENPIQFHCHIRRRSLNFAKEVIYELIQFNGHFRMNTEVLHNDDLLHYRQGNENRIIFVCTGRLSNPQLIRDVCLVDSNRSDFTSRHSLEWKFLFLDHRAPPIIGYLPFEVLGTSGYDYYHFDDLEKVITCHEALMQKGELTSCYYRFLTKGQQWIWLQTRFFITYHQWNSKPECVVCTHRVVSYADMEKGMNQEGTEVDVNSDTDLNKGAIEDAPVENATLIVSPSYVSEESNPYGNSYQPLSQTPSVKSTSASSTTGTVSTIQTVTTEGVSWLQHNQQYFIGSEAASVSSDSASSLRNNKQNTRKGLEPVLVPQHGIGVQYLEPVPYVGTIPVRLPLPSLPLIVSPDQAQLQEQLQRKHEELQEIIVRQQEELRQVKEQLLLARLGILQPIINVNPTQNEYVSSEEAQQIGQLPAPPPDYDTTARHGNNAYQQQQAPNDRTNLPQ